MRLLITLLFLLLVSCEHTVTETSSDQAQGVEKNYPFHHLITPTAIYDRSVPVNVKRIERIKTEPWIKNDTTITYYSSSGWIDHELTYSQNNEWLREYEYEFSGEYLVNVTIMENGVTELDINFEYYSDGYLSKTIYNSETFIEYHYDIRGDTVICRRDMEGSVTFEYAVNGVVIKRSDSDGNVTMHYDRSERKGLAFNDDGSVAYHFELNMYDEIISLELEDGSKETFEYSLRDEHDAWLLSEQSNDIRIERIITYY